MRELEEFGYWNDTNVTAGQMNVWGWLKEEAIQRSFIYYLWLTIFFVIYFSAWHVAMHLIFVRCNDTYLSLNRTKRSEYRTYAVAPVHHLNSIVAAIVTMFYACGDDKTVFNDMQCFDTPRNLHIICMCHTGAYFVVDTVILVMMEGDLMSEIQMLAHHLLSMLNFYAGLVWMNFTIVFGVMLLFIETSTIFVIIRWLLYTHGQGHSLFAATNTVIIFFTFLLCRLCFQVFASFFYAFPMLIRMFHTQTLSWWEITLMLAMASSVMAAICLNVFWMVLIIKQIYRMILR